MLRKVTKESNPEDWFHLAADRLDAVDLLWEHQGLTHSAVELLQEAVERYLKGFLVAKGWRLVRTHDLGVLVEEAAKYDSRFGGFDAMAEQLNEDFFAQHYPGGDLTHVGANFADLRRQTGEMVVLIKELLPQQFGS